MKALLDASFINSFKQGNEEGQSKYALMGQLLEDPTLESFWKYNEQEEDAFGKFESLYQPGLVKKKEKPLVIDSSDGVVIVNRDGEKTAIPIEVKARTIISVLFF